MQSNPYFQAQIQSLLNDPTQKSKREEELKKTFDLAKLDSKEQEVMLFYLDNLSMIQGAIVKLQPFIIK